MGVSMLKKLKYHWTIGELVTIGVFAAAAKVITMVVALAGGGMNPVTLLIKNLIFTTFFIVMLYKVKKSGTMILFTFVSMLISLLLMGLTKFLEQSQTEAKQFNLLKRIGLNESRKDKAKQVTNEFLKMVMNNKNIRQSIGELKPNSRSFLNSVKSFEESEKSVERHGDQINDYPFDNVGFAFRYFDKEYQKLLDEDKNTISEMGGMLESLEQLNEQLNE